MTARRMETIGLFLSLSFLIVSIIVFSCVKSLRCPRNRIHCNLFTSVLISTVIQLILNLDQIREENPSVRSIPILCEATIIISEYTTTAMFTWMFVEGLYLHSVVATSVFTTKPRIWLYYTIGWGGSLVLVGIWSVINGILNQEICWYSHAFQTYYWVLQAPRFAIIVVNFCFLLHIVCILVTKLRQNQTTEISRVRKTVKATVVLLPLLGSNNILYLIPVPVFSEFNFAAYEFASVILSSGQGIFISLFYCFLNSEVQTHLRRVWRKSRFSISHQLGTQTSYMDRTSVTNEGRVSLRSETLPKKSATESYLMKKRMSSRMDCHLESPAETAIPVANTANMDPASLLPFTKFGEICDAGEMETLQRNDLSEPPKNTGSVM